MKPFGGSRTRPDLEALLAVSVKLPLPGDRIACLSRHFLGVPYRAATLSGGPPAKEQLVAELTAVDCFTLLDYVEALRRAEKPADFLRCLRETRYRDGILAFESRHHFFTDWLFAHAAYISDATTEVGGRAVQQALKVLNLRQNGSLFVQGIPPVEREVAFIPAARLSRQLSGGLLTGDYVGIYSELPGLDVSHVGIVIRDSGKILFRHASARRGEVVDEEFHRYVSKTPGIMVLRPRLSRPQASR